MPWFKILAILMLVLLAAVMMISCNGTVVYHERPPLAGPNWISGHWTWNGDDWTWTPGHWRP